MHIVSIKKIFILALAFTLVSSVYASHVEFIDERTIKPSVSRDFTSLYVQTHTIEIQGGYCQWIFGNPVIPDHCVRTHQLLPDTFFTQDKGGHNHDESNRPLGTIKINGEETNVYEAFTIGDQQYTFTYTSPPFSGDIVLKTRVCTNEHSLIYPHPCFDEYRLIHVEDPLTPLTTSGNYTLIGGIESGKTVHPYNHYANGAMITFIDRLSQEWKVDHPILQINDISLKNGGHFDINGSWTVGGGHKQHIFGNDVDIHNVGAVNHLKFEKMVRRLGNLRFYIFHNNHHHISLKR